MRFPGKTLFSPAKPEPIVTQTIQDPVEIPDPDDVALKNRNRRKFSKARARSGRQSTMNTGPKSVSLG